MTLNEFKAWLDGYTEGREKITKKQLDRIKEVLENVDNVPLFPEMPRPIPDNHPPSPYWQIPHLDLIPL